LCIAVPRFMHKLAPQLYQQSKEKRHAKRDRGTHHRNHGPHQRRADSKSWLGSSFSRGFKAAVGPHTHSKPVERCKRSGLSCVCFGGRIAKRKQSQLTRRPAASFYLSLLVVVVVVPSTPSSSRPDIWCLICLGWVANRARTEDCVGGDRHHKAPTAWT